MDHSEASLINKGSILKLLDGIRDNMSEEDYLKLKNLANMIGPRNVNLKQYLS